MTQPAKNRRAWLLNHYAQEPNKPGGTRHFSLAKKMQDRGWTVSIVASSVELNTGRQRLTNDESRRLDLVDGVQFLWVRTPQYSGNGVGRLSNMLTYTLRVLMPATSKQLPHPDVVVGSSVHPFAAWAGARLARRFRVPFVFEVRDLWPQTLIDMGRLSERGLLTMMLRRLEKSLYRQASRIVVLLPRAKDYIVPLGIDPDKIDWIPNGVELATGSGEPSAHRNDVFTFMYFGAHGQANGLHNVLRAMHAIKMKEGAPPIRLRLVGDGPLKDSLVELAQSLDLTNVQFENPVAKTEIPTLAAEADAFVFNLVNAPVFRFGISSNKLFDYLAAAKPIVFACDASNNPVEEAGAGITIPPDNPDELAAGMLNIAAMPEADRHAMGNAGLNYVTEFHEYGTLARRFATLLDQVADAGDPIPKPHRPQTYSE